MSSPTEFTGMVVTLPVEDMERAITFYRDVLGFDVAWTWGEPMNHAGLCRDKVEIHLGLHETVKNTALVYIYVKDVDAFFAEIEGRAFKLVCPLETQVYGMRDFAISDPWGHQLSFGTHVGT